MAGFPPQQVGVGREGEAAGDAMVEAGAFLEAEEALGRPLAGEEAPVALVDVAGDQPGAFRIGAGDEDGRDAADVRRQPRRVEVADRRLGRDQHLAAEVAALLLARQLVLEMDARDARLDIGLHDLEAVQRPAEPGLGVGDDRREPVALGAAFGMLDLVGALQRPVDLPRQLRPGIGRVERLVGVHRAGGVGVGRGLPAGQIDGLEPGADHLHRLVAGDRAQRPDRLVALEQFPQLERAAAGQAMLDRRSSRAGG